MKTAKQIKKQEPQPRDAMEQIQEIAKQALEEKMKKGTEILSRCAKDLEAIGLEQVVEIALSGRGTMKQRIGLGLIQPRRTQ